MKDVQGIPNYRNIKPENIFPEKHKGLLSANFSAPFFQNLQLLKPFEHLVNG